MSTADQGDGRDVPGAETAEQARVLGAAQDAVAATVRAGAAVDPPLSIAQVRALTVLAEAGADGITVSRFADALCASVSSASHIASRLRHADLIEQRSAPRNQRWLALSPAGRALLAEVNRRRYALLTRPRDEVD